MVCRPVCQAFYLSAGNGWEWTIPHVRDLYREKEAQKTKQIEYSNYHQRLFKQCSVTGTNNIKMYTTRPRRGMGGKRGVKEPSRTGENNERH